MSIFRIEISTSSEFPTVDVQHFLFELVELLESRYGGARREEIQFPISFYIEGVTGSLYFRSLESEEPPAHVTGETANDPADDRSDLERFLDELNRRLDDDEANDA